MATSPQLTVVLPGGREESFPTDKWYRRWEPTDDQLAKARRNKNEADVPRIAHVQATDVLVVMDVTDKNVVAVYREWIGFRIT